MYTVYIHDTERGTVPGTGSAPPVGTGECQRLGLLIQSGQGKRQMQGEKITSQRATTQTPGDLGEPPGLNYSPEEDPRVVQPTFY